VDYGTLGGGARDAGRTLRSTKPTSIAGGPSVHEGHTIRRASAPDEMTDSNHRNPIAHGPQRVYMMAGRMPLHNSAGTRTLEALAVRFEPSLMERAGLAVAKLALAIAPHSPRVVVLAGPGNNGGDGFVAARRLHAAARAVVVVETGGASTLPDDARQARALALAAGVPIVDSLVVIAPRDLVVDALLGLGRAAREPTGLLRQAWIAASQHPGPLLAVDVPTGMHADGVAPPIEDTGATGTTPPAIRATHTLSLLTLHAGLFTGAGRDAAGEVWWDDLGVDASSLPQAPAPRAWLVAAGIGHAAQWQAPRHADHKGSRGDVIVVGGARGMRGAALLAARAALAAGCGRVHLVPSDGVDDCVGLDATPELMHRDIAALATPDWLEHAVVVAGCGGGDSIAAHLPRLLSRARRLVLDADALNAVAADAALARQLRRRSARGQITVLLPHPLEAARLSGHGRAAWIQADRLAAATRLASELASICVLKGAGTIVAAPAEVPWVHAVGNGLLATAGSGDVLAGWLAGLWAPRSASLDWNEARDVTSLAVTSHGCAADMAFDEGHRSMPASSLLARLATWRALSP
jgi:ADP-dependent NAD(P)H-hydrate dehydratase / NAD(P)H-hydrate epimerase